MGGRIVLQDLSVLLASAKYFSPASRNAAVGNRLCYLYFLVATSSASKRELVLPDHLGVLEGLVTVPDARICAGPEFPTAQETWVEEPGVVRPGRQAIYKIFDRLKWSYPLRQMALWQSERQYRLMENRLATGSKAAALGVEGLFWHHTLMPPAAEFHRRIIVAPKVADEVSQRYGDLGGESHVGVHFRAGDFAEHYSKVFPPSIVLDGTYYERAIKEIEAVVKDPIYHLFSDDMARLRPIFAGRETVEHADSAQFDWAALRLCRHAIVGNSSFAWTAALHSKQCLVMPRGGFNWCRPWEGTFPHGFAMPGAIQVDCSLKHGK